MQKVCEFCEEQYEASHTKRRFCSNSCSNMATPRGQAVKQFAEPFYKRHAERLRDEKKHKMNTDPLHRLKVKARRLAREAHPNQMPCEVCGSKEADRHHDDYNNPTNIRWHSIDWMSDELKVTSDRWVKLEDGEEQDMELIWRIQRFYQVPISRLVGTM